MYSYGRSSLDIIKTLETDFQLVLGEAIKVTPWDYSMVTGRRSKELQTNLFRRGFSKTPWPFSNHNSFIIVTNEHEIVPEYGDERRWYLNKIKDGFYSEEQLKEHNGLVNAFDFIPYPSKWYDKELIVTQSRWMQGFFASKGILLRLGIDWDKDGKWSDESFFDGGHCERIN